MRTAGASCWMELANWNGLMLYSGDKQGCVMAGFLFLIDIDWIMKRPTEDNRNGIRWKLTTTLEDLDFTDDITILSSRLDHAQDKLSRLCQFGRNVGLKINTEHEGTQGNFFACRRVPQLLWTLSLKRLFSHFPR